MPSLHLPSPAALARLRDRLGESMWLLPLVAGTAAVLLGAGITAVEARIFEGIPGLTNDPATASLILSTAATATITFAGLVFSITLLVLQLTSSQFSPRVLRQFLRAREGQLALAVFSATFVYEFTVLARIRRSPDAFVPTAATTLGAVLAVVSVAVFVGFIHHITQSIRVVNIIESVARETRATAEHVYREAEGHAAPVSDLLVDRAVGSVVGHEGHGAVLQVVSREALAGLASERGSVLRMLADIGDFVPSRGVVLEEWVRPDSELPGLRWSDVRQCFAFGNERTMNADLAFGYRQLVDIAEKALSPGINDPTTAVQAIHRLHDLLRDEARAPALADRIVDDDGNGLVWRPITFEDLVHLAFDEIRHYGGDDPQVVRRVRAALADLRSVAPPDREHVLEAMADRFAAEARRP